MFPINKSDPIVIRTREHIREQVERLRSSGKTEEEIVHWLEHEVDNEIGLFNHFDSVNELSSIINIPLAKFNVFWM